MPDGYHARLGGKIAHWLLAEPELLEELLTARAAKDWDTINSQEAALKQRCYVWWAANRSDIEFFPKYQKTFNKGLMRALAIIASAHAREGEPKDRKSAPKSRPEPKPATTAKDRTRSTTSAKPKVAPEPRAPLPHELYEVHRTLIREYEGGILELKERIANWRAKNPGHTDKDALIALWRDRERIDKLFDDNEEGETP